MGIVVNSNTPSIAASRALYETRADLEKAMERLSSGKRINSASDDAAGLSIASRLRSNMVSLNQAVRNSQDGISFLEVYDGAAAEIEDMVVRIKELYTQRASGTYSSNDTARIDDELTALKSEINQIATVRAEWAGAAIGTTSVTVQTGVNSTDTMAFTPDTLDVSAITSIAGAETALVSLNVARSEAGAAKNRLTYAVNNAMNISQRTAESLSRIEDADFAAESAALARANVLAQAGTAMLAQANQAPQYVLTLLRG
jgi:flagellin